MVKLMLSTSVLLSGLFAMHFYNVHNNTCTPGAYSRFAFCEYVVITAIVLFHSNQIEFIHLQMGARVWTKDWNQEHAPMKHTEVKTV